MSSVLSALAVASLPLVREVILENVDERHRCAAFVTRASYPESDAFPVLVGDVEVHEDLDSVIFVFDKGYVHYGRFAGMKNEDMDFVTPLKDNAKHEVVERIHDFEHAQPDGEEVQVTDEYIELGTVRREYRKVSIMHEDDDDEIYLTTLSPDEFDALEIALIYGVRWLIEIMFRKLKQYTDIQKFHNTTLNGVLFELYCTFLAYILADYYRRQYPVRGGMSRTFRVIRNYWNRPLGEYG
ncbi:IS4 family transposase (plasmid) [Natrinema zhouii]|uniref:IS4 family transposase n=1 Tax=Natrinema zhouii TaxID=1710539 RepID=UPI001CFFC2D7|nr:IS4 family transposase [Natrinema zhouii]UHQ99137.1 IS4 family transposase [Natrinema zhouii]